VQEHAAVLAAFVHMRARQHGDGILEHNQARLRVLMRNDGGPRILERLATCDVIEMVVAIDQVLDRLRRDLLDLINIGRSSRPAVVHTRSGLWRSRRPW
jgi:hypothetical protein